jgi:hypothetical protein
MPDLPTGLIDCRIFTVSPWVSMYKYLHSFEKGFTNTKVDSEPCISTLNAIVFNLLQVSLLGVNTLSINIEYESPDKSVHLGSFQYQYTFSRARRKSHLSASRLSTMSPKLEPTKPASKKKHKDFSHSNRVRRNESDITMSNSQQLPHSLVLPSAFQVQAVQSLIQERFSHIKYSHWALQNSKFEQWVCSASSKWEPLASSSKSWSPVRRTIIIKSITSHTYSVFVFGKRQRLFAQFYGMRSFVLYNWIFAGSAEYLW